MIELLPGDGIIYTGSNLFDEMEKVKLGSDATHFEVFIGFGKVVTSLLKTGVGIYNQCTDEVLRVIRPVQTFDLPAALVAFETIKGLPYGVRGLLNFDDVNVNDKGWFCSQVGTFFYRAGKIEPFNGLVEERKVSPMHYLYASERVFTVPYALV